MSNDISKYIKFLRDLENGLVEDEDEHPSTSVSLFESSELFEDHDLTFGVMADKLSIVESDVKKIFEIINDSGSVLSRLKNISIVVNGGGVENHTIGDKVEIHYVVMSDLYSDTIITVGNKFYFGSVGRLAESEDLGVLDRLS